MRAVAELAPHIGLKSACRAFGLNRGFVYRDRARHRVVGPRMACARPRPPLALSAAEQAVLLGVLDSERFVDVAPATVFVNGEVVHRISVRKSWNATPCRERG